MRPHLTWHSNPHAAGLYADRGQDSEFVDGTIVALNDATIREQFARLSPPSGIARPYLFVTISLPEVVNLLPTQRSAFPKKLISLMGMAPTGVPWMGWEHLGTHVQHFHLLNLPQTFAGRKIDLGPSKSLCEYLDKELSAWLGLPTPYYFDARNGPRLEPHFPKRRLNTQAKRDLAAALVDISIKKQPRDMAKFRNELSAHGGYEVSESLNLHGVASYEFSGPDLKAIRGGQLSPELEPRIIRARFDRALNLRNLRARIELVALTRSFTRSALDQHLRIMKEIEDARPTSPLPRFGESDARASQARRGFEDRRHDSGDDRCDPRSDPRSDDASRGRAGGSGAGLRGTDRDVYEHDRRNARYREQPCKRDQGAAIADRRDGHRAKDTGCTNLAPAEPFARRSGFAAPGSLGELISRVVRAAREAKADIILRVDAVSKHLHVRFRDETAICLDRDKVWLRKTGGGTAMRAFLRHFATLSDMQMANLTLGRIHRTGQILAITRQALQLLNEARRSETETEIDIEPPDPSDDPEVEGPEVDEPF
ncbi:hypothetical protein AB4874_18620 [Thioclava sp. 15-R06ZXC-3]|uniref:Uncharacterized protein n=1 Tax=Thioclava arctica TaxID=3238301 RepID=A0ABV3TPW3_9RHOB